MALLGSLQRAQPLPQVSGQLTTGPQLISVRGPVLLELVLRGTGILLRKSAGGFAEAELALGGLTERP